jgi:hypothetical protein
MAKSPRRIGAVELARETNLGRHLLVFNDSEVVELLRAAVEREGNQSAFANASQSDFERKKTPDWSCY